MNDIKKQLILAITIFALFITGCGKQLTEEQKLYINKVDKFLEDNGDLDEGVNMYSDLIEIFPLEHEYRQKMLQYIMESTLELVRSDEVSDIQRGLDLSMKLYRLLPGDYYVANRILGAYGKFAKHEAENKNFEKAKEWTQKGLQIRFDQSLMSTHMNILIAEAHDLIFKKKIDEAKSNLKLVLEISDMPENKDMFKEEATKAADLLSQLN